MSTVLFTSTMRTPNRETSAFATSLCWMSSSKSALTIRSCERSERAQAAGSSASAIYDHTYRNTVTSGRTRGVASRAGERGKVCRHRAQV